MQICNLRAFVFLTTNWWKGLLFLYWRFFAAKIAQKSKFMEHLRKSCKRLWSRLKREKKSAVSRRHKVPNTEKEYITWSKVTQSQKRVYCPIMNYPKAKRLCDLIMSYPKQRRVYCLIISYPNTEKGISSYHGLNNTEKSITSPYHGLNYIEKSISPILLNIEKKIHHLNMYYLINCRRCKVTVQDLKQIQ